MRPFTICYGFMTLSLGSVVVYGMANADELRSPFGDPSVFAANAQAESQPTIILPPATDKSAAASAEITTVKTAEEPATSIPVLSPGMASTDVIALIGNPDSVSLDGTHWTYGSSVLIFNQDALVGHVGFDPVQAALNKYNHMITSISPTEGAKTAKSAGPKVLTARKSNFNGKYSNRYMYRPVAAGSARSAYRYDSNNEEYSYYMNRSGPMPRMFSRQAAMPRGMMSAIDRTMGKGYRSGGTSGYNNMMSSQYFRR